MGKVYGIWPVALNPGVSTEKLEQAARRLIEQTPRVDRHPE